MNREYLQPQIERVEVSNDSVKSLSLYAAKLRHDAKDLLQYDVLRDVSENAAADFLRQGIKDGIEEAKATANLYDEVACCLGDGNQIMLIPPIKREEPFVVHMKTEEPTNKTMALLVMTKMLEGLFHRDSKEQVGKPKKYLQVRSMLACNSSVVLQTPRKQH